jgi:hypothetical protein
MAFAEHIYAFNSRFDVVVIHALNPEAIDNVDDQRCQGPSKHISSLHLDEETNEFDLQPNGCRVKLFSCLMKAATQKCMYFERLLLIIIGSSHLVEVLVKHPSSVSPHRSVRHHPKVEIPSCSDAKMARTIYSLSASLRLIQ